MIASQLTNWLLSEGGAAPEGLALAAHAGPREKSSAPLPLEGFAGHVVLRPISVLYSGFQRV